MTSSLPGLFPMLARRGTGRFESLVPEVEHEVLLGKD
jgi:hypothetical protein